MKNVMILMAVIVFVGYALPGSAAAADADFRVEKFSDMTGLDKIRVSHVSVRDDDGGVRVRGGLARRRNSHGTPGHVDVTVIDQAGEILWHKAVTYRPRLAGKKAWHRATFEAEIPSRPPAGSVIRVGVHTKKLPVSRMSPSRTKDGAGS